jgi:hypothetical protein
MERPAFALAFFIDATSNEAVARAWLRRVASPGYTKAGISGSADQLSVGPFEREAS